VIDETCQICFLSATYEGKANDKILAELEGYRLPPGSYLYQDMGFQGFVLADVTIIQPKKKPRGGELTPPEKATNRRISSIRIRIEHAIGGVNRYRIVKDKIRLCRKFCSGGCAGAVAPVRVGIMLRGSRTVRPP
jgi:hypothetical protein